MVCIFHEKFKLEASSLNEFERTLRGFQSSIYQAKSLRFLQLQKCKRSAAFTETRSDFNAFTKLQRILKNYTIIKKSDKIFKENRLISVN
jgi:hypothetical protein